MKLSDLQKKSAPLEHDEQAIVCQWLDLIGVTYFAVPNENNTSGVIRSFLIGKLGKLKGAQIAAKIISSIENKLKAAGKKKGVPDLVILLEGGKSLFIEMKRTKGSTTSKEQKEWQERLKALGFSAHICKGASEAIATIEKYLPKNKQKINTKQSTIYDLGA